MIDTKFKVSHTRSSVVGKAGLFVIVRELQFHNRLTSPWFKSDVHVFKPKNIYLQFMSSQSNLDYFYINVEHVYELELISGENIFVRPGVVGLFMNAVLLVSTRQKTVVNELYFGYDSFIEVQCNKWSTSAMKINIMSHSKSPKLHYSKKFYLRKQIIVQIESKASKLLNHYFSLSLKHAVMTTKFSVVQKSKTRISGRVLLGMMEKLMENFNAKNSVIFSSVKLQLLIEQLHYVFYSKFQSYSYHDIVLGVSEKLLMKRLQKIKEHEGDNSCFCLVESKNFQFFAKFQHYLFEDNVFKLINKTWSKTQSRAILSKINSFELINFMKFLEEAPKFLHPTRLLSKRRGHIHNIKKMKIIVFLTEMSNFDQDGRSIFHFNKYFPKSYPVRMSGYCGSTDFFYREIIPYHSRSNVKINNPQSLVQDRNEQIAETVCEILNCQLISFTSWDMNEYILDIEKSAITDYASTNPKTILPKSNSKYKESLIAESPATWTDIGGLDNVKQLIRNMIELPLIHGVLFKNLSKGLILYGPPGTGKTLLARVISNECEAIFFMIKGPEVIDMYVGESERHLRQIFLEAKNVAPSIIFFDELDALASRRIENIGSTSRVVSQLLLEIDDTVAHQNVFIIGATNRPDRIDSALLRPGRFDRLVFVGIDPSPDSKLHILKSLTKCMKLASGIDFAKLAKFYASTYSGADLYSVCTDSWLRASKRVISGNKIGEEVIVELDDFIESFINSAPSLSKEIIEYYEDLNLSFS